MGKLKLYSKLLLTQAKTKFKKPKEYAIPRCGVSYTRMTKLADEVKGVKIVNNQDTKAKTFKVTSKSPEIVFGLVSQMPEFIVENINSPSKKDKNKLIELGSYLKKLEPLLTNMELYKEASTSLK